MGVLSFDSTFSADGMSEAWNVPVSNDYMFYAVGSFGGGQLSLESSPDNGLNWFTVDTLSSAGRLIRYLVNGERVRLCLSGATSPSVTSGVRQ